jgi:hypothetical protein
VEDPPVLCTSFKKGNVMKPSEVLPLKDRRAEIGEKLLRKFERIASLRGFIVAAIIYDPISYSFTTLRNYLQRNYLHQKGTAVAPFMNMASKYLFASHAITSGLYPPVTVSQEQMSDNEIIEVSKFLNEEITRFSKFLVERKAQIEPIKEMPRDKPDAPVDS